MQDASWVGLHIDDQYYDNIVKIINNTDISQEFLFFMLQYNNATSYFSKLAFLLSALEAFVGEIEKEKSEGLYIQSLGLIYDKIESWEVKNNIEELLQTMRTKMKYPYKWYDVNNMKKVLWHDLYNKIYWLSWIRHKLFHGKKIDQSENFVEMIYGKIRDYCNQKYDGLINSNVQHPWRNPFWNKKWWVFHLEVNSDAGIELKFLLEISNELPKLEGIEFKKNDFTYVWHKIDVNKF